MRWPGCWRSHARQKRPRTFWNSRKRRLPKMIRNLALCVVLLTSAGLAYRSVSTAVNLDLSFAKDHLLLASVDTKGAVTGKEQNIDLLERLRMRLSRVPGVISVSYAQGAPPRDAWRGPVQATS